MSIMDRYSSLQQSYLYNVRDVCHQQVTMHWGSRLVHYDQNGPTMQPSYSLMSLRQSTNKGCLCGGKVQKQWGRAFVFPFAQKIENLQQQQYPHAAVTLPCWKENTATIALSLCSDVRFAPLAMINNVADRLFWLRSVEQQIPLYIVVGKQKKMQRYNL